MTLSRLATGASLRRIKCIEGVRLQDLHGAIPQGICEEDAGRSNLGNMDQVYQGYHTLPKPLQNGFEIKMWNLNGTITTPWYGGEFVEEYYKKDQDYHMVLELPEDIKDQVGSGSLVIELGGTSEKRRVGKSK